MTSAEVRQSFLDFFRSKQHEIVPSASLMPGSPNLLFTNAGMNQFVPYFLGERTAPYKRAADTQKCIRAGGKHNDLEDVGFDTYHHTFFEMLGNWSFGDYFKKEALEWSWELLTQVWKMPKERLYVTVYKPGEGDPAAFDQEAWDVWEGIFRREGMDPAIHIKTGGKKDNFWMMGDTGPCGPCSEIHIDLTPENATQGSLVNDSSPWCIEIWNNVFIQFNATEDGRFVPLKEKHVDTGMGFERVAGIIATTEGFKTFANPPSNYNADVFTPIFDKITEMCGHKYGRTMPEDRNKLSKDEMMDVVFRVLADHIRTLSCAIADGILPGNEGRNYVLRRILRRAVMFGRRLDLKPGFFTQLVEPLVATLGPVFPELQKQRKVIEKVIQGEESAFDRTLDRGLQEFEKIVAARAQKQISGEHVFRLYDTFGFPLDLTQLLAAERGLEVDVDGFHREMEKQRERARAAHQSAVITVADDDQGQATQFLGYEASNLENFETFVVDVVGSGDANYLIFERTPFYAEMGGQMGDTGHVVFDGTSLQIVNTVKDPAGRFLHQVEGAVPVDIKGKKALVSVETTRRASIQRHHTATHILHWALRKVLGSHVRQAGSLVAPDRLRFDFAHFEAISKEDLQTIENLCNERVLANEPVRWQEFEFDKKPSNAMAFFGEKYGDRVRVVAIGRDVDLEPASYETGWSVELCGGTHVCATGEIGLIKVIADTAISAGTRRIEAVCGEAAMEIFRKRSEQVSEIASVFSCKPDDVLQVFETQQQRVKELEKQLKSLQQKASAGQADELAAKAVSKGGLKFVAAVAEASDPNALRQVAMSISRKIGEGVVVLAARFGDKGTLLALSTDAAVQAGYKAGDIVRDLTGKLGGKGGGKPDFAMGGISDLGRIEAVLADYQK